MYSLRWRSKRGASIGLFLVMLVGLENEARLLQHPRARLIYSQLTTDFLRPCCPLRKVDRTHTTSCSIVLQCYDIVEITSV